MKAGRIGLYVAGAAVGAGLAYLLAILPNYGPASSETPKPVAKKGDGKARAPAAPVTAATVMASDMPVILVAPGTVEPLAHVASRRASTGRSSRFSSRRATPSTRAMCCFASMTGW